MLGLLMLGIIAFPLYTRLTWKDYEYVSSKFIFMVIAILLIIIPGVLINLNLQGMYDAGYFSILEKQVKLIEVGRDNNKIILTAYTDSVQYSQMKALDNKTNEVFALISEMEKLMVEQAEGTPDQPVSNPAVVKSSAYGQEIDFKALSRPFNTQAVENFLMPGCQKRQDLNTALGSYSQYISTFITVPEHEKLVQLLDAASYLPGEISAEWNLYMLSSLHSLEVLKSNLLTVEAILLKKIAGK
jgi:hypothetical protein